jgi:hypothetical protein
LTLADSYNVVKRKIAKRKSLTAEDAEVTEGPGVAPTKTV